MGQTPGIFIAPGDEADKTITDIGSTRFNNLNTKISWFKFLIIIRTNLACMHPFASFAWPGVYVLYLKHTPRKLDI